uniref:Transposase n=1 Tax=Leptobrachium leishanense TaxID=445787 RepID=A0A8C5WF56_9ANUR
MPRRKELSEDLRSRIVDLHEAGKGYKSISKSLDVHVSTVRQTVYKWRKFSTVATLPRRGLPVKMTARAQCRMLNEVKKNPRVSAKDLQKSLAHANIFVDTSTIRKTLNKNGVHGRTPRRKPLLSKKNIAARLKFAKEHLDVPQHYCKIFCGEMKPKLSCLEKTNNTMYGEKKGTAHQHVKHGRGSIMVWGCFAASGPGRIVVIDGKMNSRVYQDILQENVRPSVRQLKLRRGWVMQEDNDQKHTSNSTKEWLQQNKIRLLEWPSQSPDLNLIEMLWHELKRAIHTRHPKNIATLKQFSEEEWSKITPDHCAGLICNYKKRLVEVITAKGGSTSY